MVVFEPFKKVPFTAFSANLLSSTRFCVNLVTFSKLLLGKFAFECSYTDWGGGFNGKLAGLSVQRLNNLPTIQADTKLTREAWVTHEANEDMTTQHSFGGVKLFEQWQQEWQRQEC